MRLVQELQRRNVIRVAVLYVVAAWVVLQAAQLLFGLLEVPVWAGKLAFALLLLGFPLVLVFAWAYEITPEGLKRESEVDRTESITHETGRKLNTITALMAGLAIALIIAQGFIPGLKRSDRIERSKSSEVSIASIAVLPFANMSSDPEQDYFSDGLSEELLNLLAKIPQLKVISRTSSFQFKGKNEDVRAIGEKLGVAHVLEGSVRKSGELVRITAQLINATDGSHVWSDAYDRRLADIFAVQDEIAAEVVKNLELKLLKNVPEVHAAPVNPQAYNYYLQARHYAGQRTSQGYAKSQAYLDSALAVDSNYALAWAEKSRVLVTRASRGDIPTDQGVTQAREAAQRARQANPKSPEAYAALAAIATLYDWDWAAAEQNLRQAESLDAGNEQTMVGKARLLFVTGRFPEAVAVYRRAAERNPLNAGLFSAAAQPLIRMDSLSAAAASFRKALELSPAIGAAHSFLGLVLMHQGNAEQGLAEVEKEPTEVWRLSALPAIYHALGRKAESDQALRNLEQRLADGAAYQIAQNYAYRGQTDLAFQWLDRAYAQRDPGLASYIKGDPLLENIMGDPRYRAMLRKLKLPEN